VKLVSLKYKIELIFINKLISKMIDTIIKIVKIIQAELKQYSRAIHSVKQ